MISAQPIGESRAVDTFVHVYHCVDSGRRQAHGSENASRNSVLGHRHVAMTVELSDIERRQVKLPVFSDIVQERGEFSRTDLLRREVEPAANEANESGGLGGVPLQLSKLGFTQ